MDLSKQNINKCVRSSEHDVLLERYSPAFLTDGLML